MIPRTIRRRLWNWTLNIWTHFFCLCTQFMLAMRFFRLLGIWLIAVVLAIDLHLPRVWSMECLVDTHMHKRETNWPPNRTVVKRGRTTSIILFCVSWCVWRVCEFYVFILFSAKWIDSNTMEMNSIGFWTLPMVCSPLLLLSFIYFQISKEWRWRVVARRVIKCRVRRTWKSNQWTYMNHAWGHAQESTGALFFTLDSIPSHFLIKFPFYGLFVQCTHSVH